MQQMQQQQQRQQQPKLHQFVMRKASTEEKLCLARFVVPDIATPPNPTQWTKPLRMYKEDINKDGKPYTVDQEKFMAMVEEKNLDRRRAENRLRAMPLILEDADGKNNFIGKISKSSLPQNLGKDQGIAEPQTAHYFLFVLEGNEFVVYPSGDWYNFRPKIKYHTLSLEEAEEQMKAAARKTAVDRWVMKKKGDEDILREEGGAFSMEEDEKFDAFGSFGKSEDGEEEKEAKWKEEKEKDEGDEGGLNNWDYHEEVDDDEEQDFISEIAHAAKKKAKFTESGEQMKSLLKDLEESSDEGGSDEEQAFKVDEGASFIHVKAEPVEENVPLKRKKPDAPSVPSSVPGKKIKIEEPDIKDMSLEDQVRHILQRKGRMKTLKLINRFKAQIQEPEKKAEFMKIVKNLANIVEIPSGSGKKYLVLKEKYKNNDNKNIDNNK